MHEIIYIVFGWTLGLFSPLINDWVKSYRRKKEFAAALYVELEDLRYRLAISGLAVRQRRGEVDQEFLLWLRPIVDSYVGDEPNQNIRKVIEMMLADPMVLGQMTELSRPKEGVGLSIKPYRVSYLESHLPEISSLSTSLQRKIHEFRNRLHLLNEEILLAREYHMMTYRTDLGENNHSRVVAELENRYRLVDIGCKATVDKIGSILSEMRSV